MHPRRHRVVSAVVVITAVLLVLAWPDDNPSLAEPSVQTATAAVGAQPSPPPPAPRDKADDRAASDAGIATTGPPPVTVVPTSASGSDIQRSSQSAAYDVVFRLPPAAPLPQTPPVFSGGDVVAPWDPAVPSDADIAFDPPFTTRARRLAATLARLAGDVPPDLPPPWTGLRAFYAGTDEDRGRIHSGSANVVEPYEELPALVTPFMNFQGADLYEGMRSNAGTAAYVESMPGQSFGLSAGHVGAIERVVFGDPVDGTSNQTRGRWRRRLPILHLRTLSLAHFVLVALPRLHDRLRRQRALGDKHPYGFVLVTSLNDDGPKYWLNRFVRDHGEVRDHCKDCPTEPMGHQHPLLRSLLESPMLAHWFMQNADVTYPAVSNSSVDSEGFDGPVPPHDATTAARAEASLVTPIPIGVDYHSAARNTKAEFGYDAPMSPHLQEAELRGVPQTPFAERPAEVIADARVHGRQWLGHNPPKVKLQREQLQGLSASGYVHFPVVARRDLWRMYGRSAFVASPAGHGLDCHRTWEALALGAVPIVSYNKHMLELFRGLPVVVVREFDAATLTQANLAKWHAEIAANMRRGAYDMDKITNAYWWQRFRAAAPIGGDMDGGG